MTKTIYRIQHTKKNRSRKYGGKDRKTLYKLINHAVYGKTMENVRHRIHMRLVSNNKDYLKWVSKPIYISQKIMTMI